MTVRLRDLLLGFRELKLRDAPVIVHSSLRSFGPVEGGAETVVDALSKAFNAVVVPTFTYKTMVTPLTGPAENAMVYGSGTDRNRMAEFYTARMPADPLMGIIPETLRKYPRARRSIHPIQSFAGFNADQFISRQTMTDPLGILAALEESGGWVVMLGVNHTTNTSIHYAEKLAGRKQFVRWALTPKGVVECPGFPGDSMGFQDIAPDVEKFTRMVRIGGCLVEAVPLSMLFKAVITRIHKDPLALLCDQDDCERCHEVKRWVVNYVSGQKRIP